MEERIEAPIELTHLDLVVEHILAQEPVCTNNDSRHKDMQFAISTDDCGFSTVAAFNRWSGQFITQVSFSDENTIGVKRIRLDIDEMDRLCRAWITWRSTYCPPEKPKSEDDPPLDNHPF